jgi:hypothetical protein
MLNQTALTNDELLDLVDGQDNGVAIKGDLAEVLPHFDLYLNS